MELLEQVLENNNLYQAIAKVVSNKGSGGVDGMNVEDGSKYFMKNIETIKESIRKRTYKPLPVKRVEIPKPDGGVRLLGIPCVVDRIIQQAINQVLTPVYEEQFSETSYGFRPDRDCHKAIAKSLEYLNDGYKTIVDIDLEKFFDKVNHDKLMRTLYQTIDDGDLLSLIRKYLVSGIMVNGIVIESEEGTPQGGPLSPLLSNIMLNELDKELEKRGLRFVRYADDCNIYVKSERAGLRVMESITRFIEGDLKLKVNKSKSKVAPFNEVKFLGFGFYYNPSCGKVRVIVHPKSVKRIKEKLKALTLRSWGVSLDYRLLKLKQVIYGWVNYYKIADMITLLKELDKTIRTRIRMCIWKAWKTISKRYKSLIKLRNFLNVKKSDKDIWAIANTRKGYMHTACGALTSLIQNKTLTARGLVSMEFYYKAIR